MKTRKSGRAKKIRDKKTKRQRVEKMSLKSLTKTKEQD